MLQDVGVCGDLGETLVNRLVDRGVLQAVPETLDPVPVAGKDGVETAFSRARRDVVHHLQCAQRDHAVGCPGFRPDLLGHLRPDTLLDLLREELAQLFLRHPAELGVAVFQLQLVIHATVDYLLDQIVFGVPPRLAVDRLNILLVS